MTEILKSSVVVDDRTINGYEMAAALGGHVVETTAASSGYAPIPSGIVHIRFTGAEVEVKADDEGIVLIARDNRDLALLGQALSFAGDTLLNQRLGVDENES
jgi:hypothetical protein